MVAARAVPVREMADHSSYVGDGRRQLDLARRRPHPRLNPWRTPIPKVYLCSAATPPGAGVRRVRLVSNAVAHRFGITRTGHELRP